jgi:hypothetical protein
MDGGGFNFLRIYLVVFLVSFDTVGTGAGAVDSGVSSCLRLSLHPTSASRVTGNGGTGMADWALSVTWRRGYRRDMRNVMFDAGLAGPLPELLFPSVLLATALVLFV